MLRHESNALRAEHQKLLARIDDLHSVAATVGPWGPREGRLADVIAFLRNHLLPHMRAEELAVYPAVEAAMQSPGAMATMVADHRYIELQIDALLPAAAALGSEPTVEQVEGVCARLYGLWAVLRMHFAKEENVLLPILERALTPEAQRALFEQMNELERAREKQTA